MALRGPAALLFGIVAFIWPGITLVVLWGGYALVDGIFALVYAFRAAGERRWLLVLQGVVGVAAGLATLLWPGTTALVLLYVIAAWALVIGVLFMVAAIRLRQEIQGEWLLGLAGLVSVIFGVLLVLSPGAGHRRSWRSSPPTPWSWTSC
jgi:uncharacterized membrane protein HdeD (DUF308 family)